jgi:hypothetical protein
MPLEARAVVGDGGIADKGIFHRDWGAYRGIRNADGRNRGQPFTRPSRDADNGLV